MVDGTWLAGVKVTDPHPTIKAFVVGHEGDSDIVLGGRKVPVQWIRSAIGWLHDKIQMFLPVYEGHGAPGDNSPQGRVAVGQVVGKAIMDIGNRIATVAAMYIFPQFRDRMFDVASIEADIGYEQDGGSVWPTSVETVTGIAVGNSLVSRPGFPGATLLGAAQAFAATEGEVQAMALTLAEIKNAVKEIGAKPSDLFPVETLMQDSVVVAKVREEKHDVYEQNKRLLGELDEAKGLVVKTTEKYEGMLKEEKAKAVVGKRDQVAEGIMAERKLGDKQKAFAKLALKRFSSTATEEDQLKMDLQKFLDEVQADYAEVAKIHNIKEDGGGAGTDKGGSGQAQNQGGGDGAGGAGNTGSEDDLDVAGAPFAQFTNSETNPLIAGGKADAEAAKKGA